MQIFMRPWDLGCPKTFNKTHWETPTSPPSWPTYQHVDKLFILRTVRQDDSMFAAHMMMTRPAGDRPARMCI